MAAVKINLHGGPNAGETHDYSTPLPSQVLMAEIGDRTEDGKGFTVKYHVYKRTGEREYTYEV